MDWSIIIILIIGALIALPIAIASQKGAEEEKKVRDDKINELLSEYNIVPTTKYSYSDAMKTIDVIFIIDNNNGQIVLSERGKIKIFPYHEIIGCEIITDKEVTGGVGRAIVGGVIAGGAGAIVGAQTAKKHIKSYSVVIYRENITIPKTEIVLIKEKMSTKSAQFSEASSFAQNVNASIKAIISQNSKKTVQLQTNDLTTDKKQKSEIEQIKEYKELLDLGVITQKEFDLKKKELLGL